MVRPLDLSTLVVLSHFVDPRVGECPSFVGGRVGALEIDLARIASGSFHDFVCKVWPASRPAAVSALLSSSRTSGELWGFVFGEAHAFGQDDAKAVEKSGVCGVGLSDAAQADLSMGGDRQDHVMRLDPRQLFEDRTWRISEACSLLPHLEALPQHESKKADEDMSLNPVLVLMPDRTEVDLIFLDAERGLGLGELDVGPSRAADRSNCRCSNAEDRRPPRARPSRRMRRCSRR
jgi:hypothetical protein